jgi:hypothetical protein
MHLLIPFAFSSSENCRQALSALKLPNLCKLLTRLSASPLDTGDELSFCAPHERALARAIDLPTPDGQIPWAALHASNAQPAKGAWAFITPCHWKVSSTHIVMQGPDLPDFSAAESQSLLTSMLPYFEEDGITLQYDQPCRWLACGEAFEGLSTASLDRVVGRNIAGWTPRGPNATRLQRLQTCWNSYENNSKRHSPPHRLGAGAGRRAPAAGAPVRCARRAQPRTSWTTAWPAAATSGSHEGPDAAPACWPTPWHSEPSACASWPTTTATAPPPAPWPCAACACWGAQQVDYLVPDRVVDGYGLTAPIAQRVKEQRRRCADHRGQRHCQRRRRGPAPRRWACRCW